MSTAHAPVASVNGSVSHQPWVLPAILLIGFLPLLTVVPAPLADWGSHLARVAVTDKVLRGDPFWSERYEFQGFAIPNAVLDVVVLSLMRLGLPVDVAGVGFLALCYTSFVAGFVRLSRIGFVPTVLAISMAITLFYTGNVMYALVNYTAGIGLAMLAASYCLEPERRLTQKCLIAAVAVPVIAFCHIVAAGVFVTIYGAITLLRPSPSKSEDVGLLSFERILLLTPALIGTLLCLAAFLLSPTSTDKMTISWADQPDVKSLVYSKIKETAEGLSSGFGVADGLLFMVLAIVALGLWRNRANVEPWVLKVAVAMTLLPLLAPSTVGKGALLDARLFVASLNVILAILPWSQGLRKELKVSVVWCCTTRTIFLTILWLSYRPIYNRIETAFATLPPGSTLLSAYTDQPNFYLDRAPPLNHVAALAVRYGVFVPSMWAERSQQPLVLKSKWTPEWLWSHSANGRTSERLASVRKRAARYCDIDPNTHLFLLHVTYAQPFSIESPCVQK